MRIFLVAVEDICIAAKSATSVHVPSDLVDAAIFCMQPPEFMPVDTWVFVFRNPSAPPPSTSLKNNL